MSKIQQIATGQQALRADFTGKPSLPVVVWALCDDSGEMHVVGLVLNPETKEIERADQLDGFRGYWALGAAGTSIKSEFCLRLPA